MRSQKMTFGLEKAPHRSLLYALGLTREEMKRPLIGVVNAANEVVPGHLHLGKIAEAVKAGIRMAGGTPMEFPAIAVCDGLAMNHEGMRFSLTSREVITDSIEIMATAHPFDALVFIPNCDKIVPGMLMAMMRLNLPSIIMSGGPMLAGRNNTDLISVFEGVGAVRNGTMTEEELEEELPEDYFETVCKATEEGDLGVFSITAPDGAEYLYFKPLMSHSYTRILAVKDNAEALVCDQIRENSRIYPRPVPSQMFLEAPFDFDVPTLECLLQSIGRKEENKDIKFTQTSSGTIFLYSDKYLDDDLAEFLAEEQEMRPLNP